MPEIKNTFAQGIMNKDLDERLVPNGQFRDAMNVQVSTSESSQVGTVQNILGNTRVDGLDLDSAFCVGAIADEKNDVLYWFITSPTVDTIIEYHDNGTVTPVLVDTLKNVLKFSGNTITGMNIIDDLLFWTDDINEPRKINITTLKLNNHTSLTTHSNMYVKGTSVGAITEDHITVIRKRPQRAPVVLFDNEPFEPIIESLELNLFDTIVGSSFQFDTGPWQISGLLPGDPLKEWPYSVGEEFVISLTTESGNLPYNYQIKILIESLVATQLNYGNPAVPGFTGLGAWNGALWESRTFNFKIIEIDQIYENEVLAFNATQIPETDPIFERELIRFATRWKYVDGEYSAYSPFTVPIFLAGQFYFHPTDDPFNQGMESRATSLTIKDFIREDTPNDVVQVDILFKKERSTTIYSIDSVKYDATHPTPNQWDDYNTLTDGTHLKDNHVIGVFQPTLFYYDELDPTERGKSGIYKITTENIYAALPDNQILRPWDNVPRKALSQEITANRVVYGNYLQNYNLKDNFGAVVTPWITVDSGYRDYLRTGSLSSTPVIFTNNQARKSIKSLRTYYLGIVYGDEYGRETPVLTSKDASHHIPFDWDSSALFDGTADDSTRLTAKLTGNQPEWAYYFKYFIKQTTGEYYNLTLDRVYKAAGDENLWVSFPSSDRNKIEVGDYFSIKKQVDIEQIIPIENKIKIIDIKNEAPESIKFDYVSLGSAGGSQVILDNLFPDISAAPGEGVKRLLIDKDTWVDDENGLALEDLSKSDRLAVQFGIVEGGNNIKSEKYFVTGFSVETSGTDELYNLVLRKVIEQQDSWVQSSVGILNFDKGLTITVYKLEEKNPVEFEGRFFVKIISNPVTQTYLVPSTTDIYAFQVLAVLPMFNLYDSPGVFGAVPDGIYNTISTWTGNNTGVSNGLSGWGAASGELEWANNAGFDTGIENTGGWFLDHTAFVAAQRGDTTNARWSGRMWKGDLYAGSTKIGSQMWSGLSGRNQYINGLEGLISPTLSTGANPVTAASFTTQIPYQHDPSLSNALGGPRRWSSEVIDLRANWNYGITDGGAPAAMDPQFEPIPTPAPWDDTYDCVEDGGHWIHLSFLAPGVDLHDNDFSTGSGPNFDEGGFSSFSGNPDEFITMLFGYLDRITASSIYRDGISSGVYTQNDGQWIFPTVTCSDCEFQLKTTEEQEENERQWDPGFQNPGAQSVVNKLEPGSRFMIVGDDTNIYTIKRVHVKRLYNHTSWNPSPRISWNTEIIGYNWDLGFAVNTPKDSNQGGSVAHYTQILMDWITVNGVLPSSSSQIWTDWKEAVVRFGRANNRRTCYILQVDKNAIVESNAIPFDDDDDPLTVDVNTPFPDTSDNDTSQIIRFVDDYIEPGFNTLPTSPAIFETEADEDVDLNIYYEASDALPIGLDGEKGHLLAPIGTKVTCNIPNSLIDYDFQNSQGFFSDLFLRVKEWQGNTLELMGPGLVTNPGGQGFATSNDSTGWAAQSSIYGSNILWFWREDGSYTSAVINAVTEISTTGPDFYITKLEIRSDSYTQKVGLAYYNCFSFGNGVESNRIRDDFNESFILNGVKASTVLEEPYEEERRKHGLIYSGIYNSISGVNNLNQFIQAEKITKDLMPSYGSIQKLYARDKDLITLCEDKIIRVYVDKDILYNADGNSQLLATNRVLGTAEPFRGNFGISKNPESFAAESFRAYFTDKQRGAVIRLSMDGLTPISDAGMHDYFRDNLPIADKLLGSYDAHKENYNLTMTTKYGGNGRRESGNGQIIYDIDGLARGGGNVGCTDPTAINYDPTANTQCVPNCCRYENERVDCDGRNDSGAVLYLNETITTSGNEVLTFFAGNQNFLFNDYMYLQMYDRETGTCPNSTNPELPDQYGAWSYLVDIILVVDHNIHVTYGIPTGTFVFLSMMDLTEWITNMHDNWGVSNETANLVLEEYATFNTELCECEEKPGCMDPSANNYNPSATIDDHSCLYDEEGFYNKTITYNEIAKGWVSFKSFAPEFAFSSVNQYYTMNNGELWKHHINDNPSTLPFRNRNTFYGIYTESSVTPILNLKPDIVKNFNTLNYEGSQSKIDIHLTDNDYYNLYGKEGWYVEEIYTDLQEGTLNEFIDKEGKWFNYIKGSCKTGVENYEEIDTSAFNFQGLGIINEIIEGCPRRCDGTPGEVPGCCDPLATNWDELVTCDDGSCIYPESWDCVSGNCEDPGDGSGQYSSLNDCEAQLGVTCFTPTWDCDGIGNCYDPYDGLGGFATLAECEESCPVPSWDCTDTGCEDPLTGLGEYSVFSACECECIGVGVCGCTDLIALNYDPAATVDNGTCCYENNGVPHPVTGWDPINTQWIQENSIGDFKNVLWTWSPGTIGISTPPHPYTLAIWITWASVIGPNGYGGFSPGSISVIGPNGTNMSAQNNHNTAIIGPSGFNIISPNTNWNEALIWDTSKWDDGEWTVTLTNERGCSVVMIFDVRDGVGTVINSWYENLGGIFPVGANPTLTLQYT